MYIPASPSKTTVIESWITRSIPYLVLTGFVISSVVVYVYLSSTVRGFA